MRIATIEEMPTAVGKVQKLLPPMDKEIPFQGEIYISNMGTGKINAWKKSSQSNQNFYILQGAVWIVTAEQKKDLSYQFQYKYFEENLIQRVIIPKGVYYGFLPVGLTNCRILNILSVPYDKGLVTSLKANEIDFDWARLRK